MFSTPTGQTGASAYIYEAAQIANAQRNLDERMRRLCTAVYDEAPGLLEHSTDYHPQLGVDGTSAEGFVEYLRDGVARLSQGSSVPAGVISRIVRKGRLNGYSPIHDETIQTVARVGLKGAAPFGRSYMAVCRFVQRELRAEGVSC